MGADREGVLEVLSEKECRQLLASRDLGRIAFSVGDATEIFPINYTADGSAIVFRTAWNTRLRDIVMRRVAFEVDGWDEDSQIGWSVVLKGVAQEVTTALDQYATALRQHPVYPLAPGEREQWIAVYPSEISGRRFQRHG